MNLQIGDLVYFKNGKNGQLNEFAIAIIEEHYLEDLTCLENDEYTIVKVVRPIYQTLFERGKDK